MMELLTNDEEASKFINGVIPAELASNLGNVENKNKLPEA